MMMKVSSGILLAVVVLVGHTYGDNNDGLEQADKLVAKEDVTEVNLNTFFDERLDFIRRLIVEQGLDPLPMPDMMVPVPNIPGLKGQIHLQKGWVQQLSSIRRSGDVVLRFNANKVLEFYFNVGWDNIDANYSYTFKYLLGTRKGDFLSRFENMKISMLGTMDMTTNNLSVRFFKIVDVGKFSLRLEGHLADHLINVLTKFLSVVARDRVVRELEHRIMESIQEKIDEMNDLMPDPYRIIQK